MNTLVNSEINYKALFVNFRNLWGHLSRRRRLQFYALLILMVISSIAEIASIGAILPFLGVISAPDQYFEHQLMQPIISILNVENSGQLLFPITILFISAICVAGVMRLLLVWVQIRISHGVGADLNISIYRRTLYQPYSVHLKRNSSEVISGLVSKANDAVYQTLMPAMTILSFSMITFGILAVLMYIDIGISLSVFTGFLIIYIYVSLITKKKIDRDSKIVNYEMNHIIKLLQEGLGGIRDVLIDNTQGVHCRTFQAADLSLRRARANIQIISGSPKYVIEALGVVLIAIVAYKTAIQTSGFSNAIPILGTLALGAQRLLPSIQGIYASLTVIRGGLAPLVDVLDLLDQKMDGQSKNKLTNPKLPFLKSIELKEVGFKYDTRTSVVLQSINFTISKSDIIGIIGSTGSGKSTLLDIIMSLLNPTKGSILVDGIPITKDNQISWQQNIAHVPQEIFLSDASVNENIAFGQYSKDIDLDKVKYVAARAQISSTIESWPDQYNTKLGESGVLLSGGQRQRIGIARALYKDAGVIILDEATSALDSVTEKKVIDEIVNNNKDITILMIAHRLDTLKSCNLIIEIENGIIKRKGNYEYITNS
jgi:ATP-binding cassette, subfamily B, bacterial PglK